MWKRKKRRMIIKTITFVIVVIIAVVHYNDEMDLLDPIGLQGGHRKLSKITTNRTNPSLPVKWPHQLHATIGPKLEDLLRFHYILCMHHLEEVVEPYQFCAVRNKQTYFMTNPRIIGGSATKKLYQQQSVCNNEGGTLERHDEVFVQWDDLSGNSIYLLFQGNESIAIQLAIDEFQCNRVPAMIPSDSNQINQ
jgi:phosphatidylglycerophosphatase A